MSNFPRILLSLLTIGILIFGICRIVYAKDLSEESSRNPCMRQNVSSFQWVGVASSVVGAVGIIGTCFRLKALQCIYLLALLVSTISAMGYCLFIWALMPGLTGMQIYGKTAEHGVWLPEYGTITQKILASESKWSAAKACFKDIDTCRVMANQTAIQKVLYIDFGCCAPPNRCGMEQASTGDWVVSKHGLNSTDDECVTWTKVGQKCYDCDSCKAGYLSTYQDQWDENATLHTECIVTLLATTALTYYTLIQDHYLGDKQDQKHGKHVRAPI